ncbi:hypothetical protein LIER_11755 [Lithospermum erythrorhizon]|uniref:Cystatin domain-containing protein n=1 Tax=Lithospermum erythrorhizon TaxID=34254 RepID=A0AAV3PRI8_LITER
MKRMKERKMKSPAKKRKIYGCVCSPKSALTSGLIECPEYESMWRKVYGGDKMDEAGFDGEYHKMLKDFLRYYYPKQKVDGWLDEVDWNLTGRSETFKLHPECQLMWQKGYGPPDGDKLDLKGWQEYVYAMPEDKCLDMLRDLFYRPPDDDDDDDDAGLNAELWEKYRKQSTETQGFDIVDYPSDGCGIIKPMFDDISRASANTYDMLSNCSRIALDAYNQREGTDCTLYRVVNACSQPVAGVMYFITFEAINSKDHLQVFQAKVYAPPMNEAKEVLLVRPKA